jgi:hypothetical protein
VREPSGLRGRYNVELAEHGADAKMPDPLVTLVNCANARSVVSGL